MVMSHSALFMSMLTVAFDVIAAGSVDSWGCTLLVEHSSGGLGGAPVTHTVSVEHVVGSGDTALAIAAASRGGMDARSECAGALAGALEAHAAGDVVRTIFFEGGDPHTLRVGVGDSLLAVATHATRPRSVRGVIYTGADDWGEASRVAASAGNGHSMSYTGVVRAAGLGQPHAPRVVCEWSD
jgi:hypothetical protein